MNPVICVIQLGEVPISALFWSVFWTSYPTKPNILNFISKEEAGLRYKGLHVAFLYDDLDCFCLLYVLYGFMSLVYNICLLRHKGTLSVSWCLQI